MASVTDEALGLLLLESSWAAWCTRSAGPDKPDVLVEALALNATDQEKGNLTWETMTDGQKNTAKKLRAKFVLGMTMYTTRTAGTKGTGWSEDGISRFNTLYQEVVTNRKADKGVFDDYYLETKKQEKSGKNKRYWERQRE